MRKQHLQMLLLQLARYHELLQLVRVACRGRCTPCERAAVVGAFALTKDQLPIP
jgi:hypothetical protein